MTWWCPGDKTSSEPMMVSSLTHIWVSISDAESGIIRVKQVNVMTDDALEIRGLCFPWISLYPPPHPLLNEVEVGGGGGGWAILVSPCPFVSPSVRGQNRVSSVSSTILPDPFHIYNHEVCCVYFSKLKHFKFWHLFYYFNFDSVLCWFGIQYESIVFDCLVLTWYPIWINSMCNHEAAWLSSEYRCSSRYSFN